MISSTTINPNKQFHLEKTFHCHDAQITKCIFNTKATQFITTSYDKTALLWDRDSGAVIKEYKGHTGEISSVDIKPNNDNLIVTGSFDKTAKLWEVNSGKCLKTFAKHEAEIVGVSFNTNNTMIATSSLDTNAIIWDVETGKEMHVLKDSKTEVIKTFFDSKANNIMLVSYDPSVKIYDANTGKMKYNLNEHKGEMTSGKWSPIDDSIIATTSVDGTCKIWDLKKPNQSLVTFSFGKGQIFDVSFNESGDKIVTCGENGSLHTYNIKTLQHELELKGHNGDIYTATYNKDKVLSGGSDGYCRLWDANSGKCVEVLGGAIDESMTTLEEPEEEILNCSFSYDGNSIITTNMANMVKVWTRVIKVN